MMIDVVSWVGEVGNALRKDARFVFKPNPEFITDPRARSEIIEIDFDNFDVAELAADFDVMVINRENKLCLCLDVKGKMFRQR
jgi:hypothetical protein